MRKAAKEVKKRKAAALEADKEGEAEKSAGDAIAWKKSKKGKWLDTSQRRLVPFRTIRNVLGNSISQNQHPRCELDSHADTCLAGSNFIAYEHTGQTVSVYGFDDDAPPLQNIPIATCMTAHTLPDGETVILVVHQVL